MKHWNRADRAISRNRVRMRNKIMKRMLRMAIKHSWMSSVCVLAGAVVATAQTSPDSSRYSTADSESPDSVFFNSPAPAKVRYRDLAEFAGKLNVKADAENTKVQSVEISKDYIIQEEIHYVQASKRKWNAAKRRAQVMLQTTDLRAAYKEWLGWVVKMDGYCAPVCLNDYHTGASFLSENVSNLKFLYEDDEEAEDAREKQGNATGADVAHDSQPATVGAGKPARQISVRTLAELRSHRNAWPAQVAVKGPVRLIISSNGQETGSIGLPKGALVDLVAINETTIEVGFNAARATLAPDQTDLWDRVVVARQPRLIPPPIRFPREQAPKAQADTKNVIDGRGLQPSQTPSSK